MDLQFDLTLSEKYKSESQKIRVLTEHWALTHIYCPHCGRSVEKFDNNKPVADFFCPSCLRQYELKSKNGRFGNKIGDGAYRTMIDRIQANDNPDFLLLNYSRISYRVTDLTLIPKHFFIPDIIEMRKPLSEKARRAGWTGCNILFKDIPSQGKIAVIQNGIILPKEKILTQVRKSDSLLTENIEARGWLLDVLLCIDKINKDTFSLEEVYSFETELRQKHPQNKNIRPKIRQQLQELRDRNIIEFLENGHYLKK